MSTPILIVGGYAYRINAAGSLERTEAQCLTSGRAAWFLVTHPTRECHAAHAGLIAAHSALGTRPATQETVREVLRMNATRTDRPDAREVAAAKGLKLWNGGGLGVVRRVDATLKDIRDTSSVHVYACAKSRAELLRMICAYNGVDGPQGLMVGVQAMIKDRWSEGAWGNSMEGVEPEPGLWVQWGRSQAPVRVWPQESADAS